ncbi:protein of unknown function [Candidatus Nitrosotalea okcheonensis]|uniref:Uncharacterized protein n=1 Tax=Candidatus Nitrosotalea okcheonensis TaxID=1903276 RepID=A0A2H1FEL9_9ARCH|nr:protein of unknown function [Candidatus Nitrosotalea okcheonensis]
MQEINDMKKRRVDQNLFWLEQRSGGIYVKFHSK